EIIGDGVMTQKGHMIDRFFTDGITDTIANISGACIGWILISKTRLNMTETRAHPRIARAIRNHLLLMLPIVPIGLWLLVVRETSYDALAVVWIIVAALIAYGIMISGKDTVRATKDS
ncbi:TPA: hypothetical protein HA251_04140, partial [Candidatus Woesearchaeota archaeon]|nr:hypothetical protein [Candidatus Woesearchaeota archaeon]